MDIGYSAALPACVGLEIGQLRASGGLAVEGGGCNYGYSVYDENLNLLGVVKPDLPWSCGYNSNVFWEDKQLNFLDQDPVSKNVFSWYQTDFKLQSIDCKRIIIDSSFHTYASFLIKDQLFISGSKQLNGDNEYFVQVYSRDGLLLNSIKTDGLLVGDMNIIGGDIMYFGSRRNRSEVIILDKSFRQKSLFKTPGHTSLLPDKILVYKNNKILSMK